MPSSLQKDGTEYEHEDAMGRIIHRKRYDRYIHSTHGRLRNLYVQATDDVRSSHRAVATTWRRTHIRSVGPTGLSIAYWPMESLPNESREWTGVQWIKVCAKWTAVACALSIILPFGTVAPEIRNQGNYEPLLYRNRKYLKLHQNIKENNPAKPVTHWNAAEYGTPKRPLRPQLLCYLTDNVNGFEVRATTREEGPTGYLFIAYASHHFSTDEAKNQLMDIAIAATRNAELEAFWIGLLCLPGFEVEGTAFNL